MQTSARGRKSEPPMKQPNFTLIKAREMPDFNKLAFKPIKDSKELTIPEGFDLMSLKRHEMAKQHQQAKLMREAEEE